MAITENAPVTPHDCNPVPHIDLSKTFNSTSVKNNRKKNSPSSGSHSRKPMGNLNRLSSHAKPLGLLSPPSSLTNVLSGESESELNLDHRSQYEPREKDEDPARLLISPPPEEELQQVNISRRSSFHKPSTSHLNDTTKSTFSSIALTQPKRKRSMASTLPYSAVSRNDSFTTSATEAHATPNPKPRKQSRKFSRAHVRAHSNQSDISMESIPSPVGGSRIVPSTSIGQEYFPPASSLAEDNNIHATPSRKRRQSKLIQSPHAINSNADYLPPFRVASDKDAENDKSVWPYAQKTVRTGRRSVTPAAIPPYEPPAVVFTPPREVVLSLMTSATKSKRKVGKSKGLRLDTHIKSEPPDIDYLKAPMPPASPTDDPLLLSGPPEGYSTPSQSRSKRFMRDASVSADFVQNEQQSFTHGKVILPPSSPPAQDDSSSPSSQPAYHWQIIQEDDQSTDSMELDMQPHEYAGIDNIPRFGLGFDGFPVASAGEWSDSDDQEPPRTPVRETGVIDEGIGEFTGHWRMTQIPTKADPPSSATQSRMDDWGRPKSPYPYRRPSSRASISRMGSASPSPSHPKSRATPSTAFELDKAVMSVPPPDEDHTITLHPLQVEPEVEEAGLWPTSIKPSGVQEAEHNDELDAEELEVRAVSIPPDDEGEESADEEEVRRLSLGPEGRDEENGSDSEQEEARDGELNLNIGPYTMLGYDIAGPSGVTSTAIAHTPHRIHSAEAHTVSSPALFRDMPFPGRPSDIGHSKARISALERAKELFGARTSPIKPSPGLVKMFDDDEQETGGANVSEQVKEKPVAVAQVFEEEEEELVMDSPDNLAEMSSGDESDDPITQDPGLVQITSSDPKAAARAAAILKQHDYDCFTKIVLKQQQERTREISHPTVEKLKRDCRRKTLSGAGISKGKTRSTSRRSLGTIVGEMVYIPGSPVTTLGGLLEEAEKEVQSEQSRGLTPRVPKSDHLVSNENALIGMALGERTPDRTPLHAKYRIAIRPQNTPEHEDQNDEQPVRREWTKEEWKILDACFTDERIDLASRSLPSLILSTDEEIPLAEVDLVDIDNVVERFIVELGGSDILVGLGWSRDGLRARVKAIQKKQRTGHIAPPTTPYTPRTVSNTRESSTMEIPDFTPLGRRPFPPARKPISLPPPAGPAAPFSSIPEDVVEEPRWRKVPATLLAPRYSHLLDEAVALSRELPPAEPSSFSNFDNLSQISSAGSIVGISTQPKTRLGRLFSYIPGFLKTPAPSARQARDSKPGLPLPPAEILDKPRGPIVTPARLPVPKSKAPKELVNLNHQPVPGKKESSMIPRRIPQRMVKLNQIGLPEKREPAVEPTARPRRSSGGSVKDLIKTFESFDENLHLTTSARSIGNWQKHLPGSEKNSKPMWKP
ncbi:hypothetical protein J3R30DRAFT_191743 [Lentinula aciculospora]|uniref:Uncharacterized protein n=1 Tax=Lentinula aciculospora TaxID=153920 RepID=A0A9W9AA19_9AGAR|nr:hypothetical protein J3R30DRAFT_191743 [Lentinula aciculospora]